MRFVQIENFFALAHCKRFSDAAKYCFISQPALSKNISSLEQELGVTLFNRTSRGVELTEAGKYMYDFFSEKKSNYFKAIEKAKSIEKSSQMVRLAIVDGINDSLFWDFLHQFYEEFSLTKINFSLSEGGDRDIATQLMEGEIDCAVTPLSSYTFYSFQNSIFQYIPFYHASHRLYYSKFYSLTCKDREPTIQDFKDSLFFLPSNTERIKTSDGIMRTEDYFSMQLGYPIKVEYCQSISLVYQNIILGRGITILLDCINYGWNTHIHSIPLKLDMEPSELVFIWRKKNANPALQGMLKTFSTYL